MSTFVLWLQWASYAAAGLALGYAALVVLRALLSPARPCLRVYVVGRDAPDSIQRAYVAHTPKQALDMWIDEGRCPIGATVRAVPDSDTIIFQPVPGYPRVARTARAIARDRKPGPLEHVDTSEWDRSRRG